MPLDPNIILQGRVPDVGAAIESGILNAGRLSAMQTEQLQRDLLAERISQLQNIGPINQQISETQLAGERSKLISSSVMDTARQLQPILAAKDADAARRVIFSMKDQIRNIPGSEKVLLEADEIVRQIDEGDLSTAQKIVEGILSADKSRRSPYMPPVEVVMKDKDGVERTYTIPYDTRSGTFDPSRRMLSPKTPGQQGAVSQARKEGEVTGEARATAKIDLPKVRSNGVYLKDKVREVLDHPAFESLVGMPSLGKVAKFVSGTPEADLQLRMKQITGKQFMQAYETLKGGGQITEIEGQKATEAMSRMNTASSEEAFREAAMDFISEIDRLERLAEQRASGKEPQVKRLRYNPETGKIE